MWILIHRNITHLQNIDKIYQDSITRIEDSYHPFQLHINFDPDIDLRSMLFHFCQHYDTQSKCTAAMFDKKTFFEKVFFYGFVSLISHWQT